MSGHFFVRSFSLFLWIFPLVATLIFYDLMQSSDFLSSFYVAGRLIATGRANELYPANELTSLKQSDFNNYAMQVLPYLHPNIPAAYFYPPTTALLFVWSAWVSPQIGLLIWQVLSIMAFVFCMKNLASISGKRWIDYCFVCAFFLPLIHNILIGQLAVVIGLLPLSLGLRLLYYGRRFLPGVIFSLLLLKPQFLLIAILLMSVLALTGEFACGFGFLTGSTLLLLITFVCFGPDVVKRWLLSLKLAETIFSDQTPLYTYPRYLAACLPAAILQLIPNQIMSTTKLIVYGLSAVTGFHCLFNCYQLVRHANKTQKASYLLTVFVLAVCILPIIMPHFLFYDLSIFCLAGVLIYSIPSFYKNRSVITAMLCTWIATDIYCVTSLTCSYFVHPIILMVFFCWLYWQITKAIFPAQI